MGEFLHLQEAHTFHQNYKEIMNITISSAQYVAPLSVSLLFSDGTTQTVDVGNFIRKHPHPQYNSYLNEKKFKRFQLESGNIVWGKNWDLIFPIENLYAGRCE